MSGPFPILEHAVPDAERLRARSRSAWRLALALAFAGLACAMLLGGLAAWFLGAVAIAGLTSATAFAFNFHVPGALVRLLAIGRTAARYGERLTGHAAALGEQVARRGDMFRSMAAAPAVRQAGWQLGDQAALADFLEDVEDIDFGRLRVDLPATTLGFGILGGLIAGVVVSPIGAVAIMTMLLVCAAAASRLWAATLPMLERARKADREAADRVGSAAEAVVSLRAEDAWQARFGAALEQFGAADRERLQLLRAQADLDALCGAIGPFAALAIIVGAWLGGAQGGALLVPVFVAFAWLALGEALSGVSRMVIAQRRRAIACRAIEGVSGTADISCPDGPPAKITSLSHAGITRRAPDGRALGKPLATTFETGKPTVLIGPSGVGKTSLLKQVAGWIGDDAFMDNAGNALTPEARRALSMVCPHDAAILADTVRANLFAPAESDDALWAALTAVELDDRIRLAGGLDGWITQDRLSLGEAQRLNLARALLTDRPVVLLDEPGEHLDGAQGQRIVGRLLATLSGRIVVASSHRGIDVAGVRIIDLGGG